MCSTVIVHKQNCDCNLIDCRSDNPFLDMHLYEVELSDGELMPLTANLIAQAMYAQCGSHGNNYLLLECFVDVQKDPTAISLEEQKAVYNSQKYLHLYYSRLGHMLSMEGQLYVMGEAVRHKKVTSPTVAEYAVHRGLDHEPSFNWWVPHMLKKYDALLSLLRSTVPGT